MCSVEEKNDEEISYSKVVKGNLHGDNDFVIIACRIQLVRFCGAVVIEDKRNVAMNLSNFMDVIRIQESGNFLGTSGSASMSISIASSSPCSRLTPITTKFISVVTDMDQDWDQYCGSATDLDSCLTMLIVKIFHGTLFLKSASLENVIFSVYDDGDNSMIFLNKTLDNHRFQDGETALHCAAARGHLECVQSLLDAGASADAIDQNGQTALHLALKRSHIDIALLLITKGCKLDIQDKVS
ncbi:unnamed protein product [Onchocerca flexuosa]|uniref:ANK_REP_REGION domain-containing protein n=1 Tax=Onchocerca flexuosa TaxID=387005 RepID=A0A183I3T5_9BILA|nr:unnamed protein product [Onchocerca flexuosa]